MEYPSVACVLLVAAAERQRELAPWLRVVGEPVRYDLDLVEPCWVEPTPEDAPWSVVVIDGDSIPAYAERESILRRMSALPFTTTLYVAPRSPPEPDADRDLAWTWASDTIWQGWEFGDRLRRRVQQIALAPWFRSMALRSHTERLGDRRLRVLRPPRAWDEHDPEGAPGVLVLSRALPFVLAERAARVGGQTPALVASAFHEGRRVAAMSVWESAERACRAFADKLHRTLDAAPPDVLRAMEASFPSSGTPPLLAARFGGALYAAGVLRDELKRIVREELAAIERHDARPM